LEDTTDFSRVESQFPHIALEEKGLKLKLHTAEAGGVENAIAVTVR